MTAQIVGGPRDGEWVRVVGQQYREPDYLDAETYRIRTYDLKVAQDLSYRYVMRDDRA